MTHPTMLERAARGMFDSEPNNHPAGHIPRWEAQPEHLRESYRNRASAVLTTLLDPTEEMIAAGKPHAGVAGGSANRTFTAMIRTALQPRTAIGDEG